MFAGFQSFKAYLGVHGWNRQVDDDVDIRVREQLIRSIGARNAVFLRLFPGAAYIQVSAGRKL
ncbi:hypothetical protein D3C79_1057540 [compost metagenome]